MQAVAFEHTRNMLTIEYTSAQSNLLMLPCSLGDLVPFKFNYCYRRTTTELP